MKALALRIALGFALGVVLTPSVQAQQSTKALPTLLIKGDIVSLDQTDPAATLLTVKDRYGFETPIYLSAETALSRGEQAVDLGTLNAGTTVEVEYNFDVNTAKRHAVTVKVAEPAAEAAPAAEVVPAAEAVPMPEAAAVDAAAPAEPAAEVPAADAMPEPPAATETAPEEPAPAVPEGVVAP